MKQKGSALITLLIFVAVALTVTTGAVTVAIINTQGISKFSQGEELFHVAETGVEEAVLQLLRDPDYTGDTLSIDSATVTITVTGAATKTITSTATEGSFSRSIQAVGTFSSNEFDLTSWQEVD